MATVSVVSVFDSERFLVHGGGSKSHGQIVRQTCVLDKSFVKLACWTNRSSNLRIGQIVRQTCVLDKSAVKLACWTNRSANLRRDFPP